jgi:uncharacterized membrane protein HdeD (DUF308 family)
LPFWILVEKQINLRSFNPRAKSMSDAPVGDGKRVAEAIGSLWWLPLLRGILLLILGGYALFRPEMPISALAQVIGFFVMVDGIFTILAGVLGKVPSRWYVIVRGTLETLAGLFVIANPLLVSGITAAVLLCILAITAILVGLLEITAAIHDRKEFEGGGWIIFEGASFLLFGVLVLMAPLSFGLLIVRLLGGFAIFSGASLILFALRLRRLGKQ